VRTWRAALVALCIGMTAAGGAPAHDSHSPPGARHRWLPDEEWVMAHWIPFDEARLYDELGVGEARVFDWLLDDHRTIADLAERRGVRLHGLGRRLLANRRPHGADRQYRILLRRTRDVLTQGHLAQHTLFHLFHGTPPRGWWRKLRAG
jgi:GNAT superfamily N-acetyltransferase